MALQDLIDCIAATKVKDPPLFDVSKKRTRATRSASSHFYDAFLLTDVDKFPKAVACFEEIAANSQIMDSSIQQSIISVVTFAVAIAVASFQVKYIGKIFSLYEIIEKSLLLRDSSSATPSLDPNAIPKIHPDVESLSKALTER